MPYFQAILLGLGCAILIGCVNPDPIRNSAKQPTESLHQSSSIDNAVHLLVATIVQPVGDSILNDEVWTLTDEQMKDLDQKSNLVDNGFRIGVIGLSPPPSLRDLIQSPRSCSDPRRLRLLEGTPTEIKIGPVKSRCSFQLEGLAENPEFKLDQAECLLSIEAHRLDDGSIELKLTPVIRHGKPGLDRQPVVEPGGILRWNTTVHQKVETFQTLSWKQSLGDSDYLIIGCWADRLGTLGQMMFLDENSPTAVQRLVVIRTIPVSDGPASKDDNSGRIATIAKQAGTPISLKAAPGGN